MPWGYAFTAAVGYLGTQEQVEAGERGAKGQEAAARYATDEQRRQFDITQANLQPWLDAGKWALPQQMAFLQGDWSGFENSPDYKFAVQQGFKGLDAGAAARGNLWGGGTDADRMALGQGLATQYANNYWNRLAGLSNTGQNTANTLGQYGANFANQAGQNAMLGAQARASSYANTANAWGNYANQLGQMAGNYYQNQQWGGP